MFDASMLRFDEVFLLASFVVCKYGLNSGWLGVQGCKFSHFGAKVTSSCIIGACGVGGPMLVVGCGRVQGDM
jgi:hypothetical protein